MAKPLLAMVTEKETIAVEIIMTKLDKETLYLAIKLIKQFKKIDSM